MKTRVRLLLILLGIAGVSGASTDWPRFRGPQGDNTVPGAKIATSFPEDGPKVLWRTGVNVGYGGAAVVGDEVFILDRIPGERDVVKCLKLKDGKELWSWGHDVPGRINHPGSRMVPTVTGDTVYATSGFGHVYAIDRETHEPRWVLDVMKTYGAPPPQFGYAIQPVVHENLCIVAPLTSEVGLVALDRLSGKEVWRTESVGGSQSSPVLVKLLGREMITMPGTGEGRVILSGFDPKTGKRLFHFSEEMKGNVIPNVSVIDESRFFLTGSLGFGSQFFRIARSDDGYQVTRTSGIGAGSTAQPGLKVGDHIYITSAAGRGDGDAPSGLVCLDLDGKVLFASGAKPAFNEGNLIDAGGVIVTQDGKDGTLRLVEPGDRFKLLAEGKVFEQRPEGELWAPMALAGSRLLMRSQNELVCVDLTP